MIKRVEEKVVDTEYFNEDLPDKEWTGHPNEQLGQEKQEAALKN